MKRKSTSFLHAFIVGKYVSSHHTPRTSRHRKLIRGGTFLVFISTMVFAEVGTIEVEPTEQRSKEAETLHHESHDHGLHGVSDFAKLNLETHELLGSRWAIEQNRSIRVFHAVDIVDALLIDKHQLTLRVELNIRQRWMADGLKFPKNLFKDDDPPHVFLTVKPGVLNHIWSPDSYISSSRESNMAISAASNRVVYIFPNMTIIYKVRTYTNVACSANFVWYPLDQQVCLLVIESYKYYDKFVNYQWENDKIYRPVTTKIERFLQYDLKTVEHSNGTVSRGGKGVQYPYVVVKFIFERKLGNNILQVFTPTLIVVILSWFSFWLGLDAIPGRISLLVTCILTLVTMHSGLKGSIPPVHYITMMDVWLVTCMAFVFASICEFVLVKYMHWRHQLKEKMERTKDDEENRKFNAWLEILQLSMQQRPYCSDRETLIRLEDSGVISTIPTVVPKKFPNVNEQKNPKDFTEPFMVKSEISSSKGFPMKRHSSNSGPTQESPTSTQSQIDQEKQQNEPRKKPWIIIDQFCRGFFPFLFCIFNGIYWPILFHGSCNQDTNKEV